jgi:ABC-type transport system involved in multi-copper enzyme maturation permease subunit
MLWYKAWRESQVRFLVIAFVLAGFCGFAVLYQPWIHSGNAPIPIHLREGIYSENIYNLVYSGTAKGLFAVLVVFLGLGGLQRERSHKTAFLTLALPVSRLRVIWTQVALGLVELATLALLPAGLIPVLSLVTHRSFPLEEALHFSALWFCCGVVIYAASFLLSVVTSGEYTAPIAAYILLMVHTSAVQWRPLAPYRLNLLQIMGEFKSMRWDQGHTLLLPPPLPWTALFVMAMISIALFAAAIRVTQRQDF